MSHSYQRSFERNVVTDTKRITFRVTKHAPSGRKSVPHFCKGFLCIIFTYVQRYALSQFGFFNLTCRRMMFIQHSFLVVLQAFLCTGDQHLYYKVLFFSYGCFHLRYVISQKSSYSSDNSRLSGGRDKRRGPRGRKRYRRLRWHQTGNSVLILLKLVSDGLEVVEVQTFGCRLASDPV